MIADDFPLWTYRARVARVVDGDTMRVIRDCGCSVYHEIEIRLLGINAPEMHTSTRADGEAARDFLAFLIEGKQLYLRTEKDHRSFTRYIASVWFDDGNGELISVSDAMIASGHAAVYEA